MKAEELRGRVSVYETERRQADAASRRFCRCGCRRSLEGKRSDARWFSDACRKRGPAGWPKWTHGYTLDQLEALEDSTRKRNEWTRTLEGLIRGDASARPKVNRSFNRSRTRGLWDSKRNSTGQQCLGIWDAYAQGRDGLLDDLMAQAESKIRELEIIQPPSPVIRTVDPSIVRKPQRRRERQEVEVAELPGQVDRNDAVNELEQAA